MGGRREVSIVFYRPVTRGDLKQERLFFRRSVSTLLQLVVASIPQQFALTGLIFNKETVFILFFLRISQL